MVVLASAGATAVLALAACSGGGNAPTGTASLPSTPAANSPSTSPTPVPEARSLLSGRLGMKDHRVLVVKMDNTPEANPHSGITQADVVYLEEVEGGLSRYAVVYSTLFPKIVGPVRSARITDIELLRQYGKVAFAYSGAQPRMLPVLAQADLYDVSADQGSKGYFRDYSRPAPYNMFGVPKELFQRAPQAVHAHDVGFRFSTTVPAGGVVAHRVSARYPSTKVTVTWSPSQGRWLAAMNGQPAMATEGGQLGGTTVIIQYVEVTPSPYHDVLGHNTTMSHTVGIGRALILRNGRAWAATWSRPTPESGTRWLVGGQDFPLAPGQVWVLLINRIRPATIR